MAETYVSPEYKERLDTLAERLVTPERFGGAVAVAESLESPQLPLFED